MIGFHGSPVAQHKAEALRDPSFAGYALIRIVSFTCNVSAVHPNVSSPLGLGSSKIQAVAGLPSAASFPTKQKGPENFVPGLPETVRFT